MKTRAHIASWGLSLLLAFWAGPAEAQETLIVNGDFEAPVVPLRLRWMTFTSGDRMPGWQVQRNSVDVHRAADIQPAAGRQSLDLTGSPGQGWIHQDIRTVPETAYVLRFAVAGNPNAILKNDPNEPDVKHLTVRWNGQSLATPAFDVRGRTASNPGWVYLTYTVYATSTRSRLEFGSHTGTYCGPMIDDVSLKPEVVEYSARAELTAEKWTPRKPRGRRGVQAVLLSHWSKTSCDRFIGVCRAAKSLGELEIAVAPYVKDHSPHTEGDNRYTLSGVTHPTGEQSNGKYAQFETIRYVVNNLLDVYPKKKLFVTVHFGFHAPQKGDRPFSPNPTQLKALVQDFHDKFFQDYKDVVQVVLSPSLEDEYKSDEAFKAQVKIIAEKMRDLKALSLRGGMVSNTWVRRSTNNIGIKAPYVYPIPSKFPLPNNKILKPWKINVKETEVHGDLEETARDNKPIKVLDLSNVKIYSNDGNVVWFDNPRGIPGVILETSDVAVNANAGKNPDKYSLSGFIKSTYASGKVVLLWRHAYNLYPRDPKTNRTVDNEPIGSRNDNGTTPKFDPTEEEVLRLFLGVL